MVLNSLLEICFGASFLTYVRKKVDLTEISGSYGDED
jgi:hypothetical protein